MKKNQYKIGKIVFWQYLAIFTLLFLDCENNYTYSQYYIGYTQVFRNEILINPAYAASKDNFIFSGNVRQQWTGIENAPSTKSMSVYGPIPRFKIGVGLNIVNDRIGITKQNLYNLVYAYNLNLKDSKFSFGINMGLKSINADFNELLLESNRDVNFNESSKRHNLPFFGLGTYFEKENYSIGLSLPYFLDNAILTRTEAVPAENKLFFFLTGAVLTKLNSGMSIKSGVLVKGMFDSNIEIDLVETLYINDAWSFGISYKSLNSIGIIAEYGYNKQLYISYSYDFYTSILFYNQSGSHEITLTYILNRKRDKLQINPRYF